MNYNQLSLEQAPSIDTPLRFFLTAPVFAIAAACLLLISGPDILSNRWLPETIALTHLLTLGFITMAMFGAMFQLLPVLAGAGIQHASFISKAIHLLYTSGVILLTLGLASSHSTIIKLSLLFLMPGILTFLIVVTYSLIKAPASQASLTSMRLAIIALWISITIGALLAAGHGWSSLPLLRQFTAIHIAWATLGWIMFMVIAVAYQVIPMFQVTHHYPKRYSHWLTPTLFISLLIWTTDHYFLPGQNILNIFSSLLIGLLIISFIVFTLRLQLQRKKRLADATLYFWYTGLTCLTISVFLYFYAYFIKSDVSLLIGIIFINGFVISIINGMLYKIVPFLVWLHIHRHRTLSGQGIAGIPTMNEVITRKKTHRQFYLHLIALILSVLAVFYPTIFFYPAALTWLINWTLIFIHLLQAMRLYKNCLTSN